MSSAELWELHLMAVDNSLAALGVLLSIVFAYLAVAYFVGARLGRFQVAVVSILFCFGAALTSFITITEVNRAIVFVERLRSSHGEDILIPTPVFFTGMSSLMALSIPVSLLFMYQIRRNPKLGVTDR